jgi:hypothetical protein
VTKTSIDSCVKSEDRVNAVCNLWCIVNNTIRQKGIVSAIIGLEKNDPEVREDKDV